MVNSKDLNITVLPYKIYNNYTSKLDWIALNIDTPTINPYAVQVSELTTADSWLPTFRNAP